MVLHTVIEYTFYTLTFISLADFGYLLKSVLRYNSRRQTKSDEIY